MTMTRNKEMPCLNCRLIEMGEMACYQVSTITISTSIVITIIIISIVNTIIIIIIITSTNDQDRCPQCGRVPPSKKGLPPEKISQASFFGGVFKEVDEAVTLDSSKYSMRQLLLEFVLLAFKLNCVSVRLTP